MATHKGQNEAANKQLGTIIKEREDGTAILANRYDGTVLGEYESAEKAYAAQRGKKAKKAK